jgi:hypothetical protein
MEPKVLGLVAHDVCAELLRDFLLVWILGFIKLGYKKVSALLFDKALLDLDKNT